MLDGAARLDELVAAAVADGQPALGITDHGNMYGVLEFYKECRGREAGHRHRGVHGLREPQRATAARGGASTTPAATPTAARSSTTTSPCWPRTNTGYRNLIQLSSLAFLEGYYYKPRMDWELLGRYHEGLIATTGCLGGHVLQSLLQGDEKGALDKAGRLQDIFGKDNLFVELQDHGLQAQRDTNPKLVEIARRIGAPLLATNDSHYTHREDHEAHDALLCVQTGATLSDPKRFKFEGQEHYLKTGRRDAVPVRDLPEACDNTLWIAERADVNIEFGKPQLPDFPIPEGFTDAAAYLDHLTWEGRQGVGCALAPDTVDRGWPTS